LSCVAIYKFVDPPLVGGPCHCCVVLFTFVCDVTGQPLNNCDAAPMTSAMEEPFEGHVTTGGVVSDVIGGYEAQSLLLGCIDDVTSLRGPTPRNIKVFVCSTGTGH